MNRQRAETILEIRQPWTVQDIRKAYKKKAKQLHPDKQGLAEKFIELKEAHDYLLTMKTSHTMEHPSSYSHEGDYQEMIDLLTKLVESYQSALIPLILSMTPKKQQWIIDFLELYGSFLLGEDAKTIVEEIRKQQVHTMSTTSSEPITHEKYQVYLHEMLMDRIIIEETDNTYEYIPSWKTEFNGNSITRSLPDNVSIDTSSNHLYFHVALSIKDLLNTTHSRIFITRTYFSGEYMIHVVGYVERDELRIFNYGQRLNTIIQYKIFSQSGDEMICRDGKKGIFCLTESTDEPTERDGCSWCIYLRE